jgi:hypothetical protein
MNSVGSLRKMFDRTARDIKRAMDWLNWISMGHGSWVRLCDIGDWRLEELAGGGRGWEEVADLAGSIHISSPILILFSFFFLHFHLSCFMFHISYFKNILDMNSEVPSGRCLIEQQGASSERWVRLVEHAEYGSCDV